MTTTKHDNMGKTMAISYNPPSVSDLWRKVRRATLVRMRAIRVKSEVNAYYHGTVHNCARVSEVNNTLSFAVHRVGIFGGPEVEQISRPDIVQLSETDRCVIVKDGYVYELRKEER